MAAIEGELARLTDQDNSGIMSSMEQIAHLELAKSEEIRAVWRPLCLHR